MRWIEVRSQEISLAPPLQSAFGCVICHARAIHPEALPPIIRQVPAEGVEDAGPKYLVHELAVHEAPDDLCFPGCDIGFDLPIIPGTATRLPVVVGRKRLQNPVVE